MPNGRLNLQKEIKHVYDEFLGIDCSTRSYFRSPFIRVDCEEGRLFRLVGINDSDPSRQHYLDMDAFIFYLARRKA